MSIPQSGGGPVEHYDQLIHYLSDGCKPRSDWKVGTEHEKFGFCKDNLKPIPYEGPKSVKSILIGLKDKYDWEPIFEAGNIIGLVKDGANVSLEPGGQLELSGAPLGSIHETCHEVNTHLSQVKDIADKIGIGFIGLGAAPTWKHHEMSQMPKGRYRLMTDYMDKVGTMGKVMMYRTCTVQVNLDFESEIDMITKMRVAIALQPVSTALFANSPFFEGKLTDCKSWRSRVWRDLDAARTGTIPFIFEPTFGFERWVNYALDVPMYFVYRDGKYINALGQSFRDFLKGKLPALPNELPTLNDWADHLTTIFPEARLKTFIEMRGADGGPWRSLCALPAFWVGLCYNQSSLDAAYDLVKTWTPETREKLRVEAADKGLNGKVGNIRISELAKEVVEIANEGLKARSIPSYNSKYIDETHFLDEIKEVVDSKRTAADKLIELYHNDWCGDISKVFDQHSY
jgi:glutamate--cysteine ligase